MTLCDFIVTIVLGVLVASLVIYLAMCGIEKANGTLQARAAFEGQRNFGIWKKVTGKNLTYEEWLIYKGCTVTIEKGVTNYPFVPTPTM